MTSNRNPASTLSRRAWRAVARGLAAVLALALGVGGALYIKAEHVVLGAEAYVFGLPLVLMDLTRDNAQHNHNATNTLQRVRQFPNASFHDVVRPNVDTLYTSAFIDLDAGPWVLTVAPNDQRYELMALLDAWTDVFAAPGTRTHGSAGGHYLLARDNWVGDPPAGMSILRGDTDMAWLIGRIETRGTADYATVHAMQDGTQLIRLADWRQGVRTAPHSHWQAQPIASSPVQRLHAMSAPAYFNRLMALLTVNPPREADAPMVRKMARIGLNPGQAMHWSWLEQAAVSLGRAIAQYKLEQELHRLQAENHGWQTPPDLLGRYGTAYNVRAAVALVGLGANWAEDAIYPQATTDSQGQTLSGKHRYRLHFAANALPPVQAFWSITAYGADNNLLPTPRHAVNQHDALHFNADGSLDLWIQASPPAEAVLRPNWLPVIDHQPFTLSARLYWPQATALNGAWTMPPLIREN